MLSAGKLLMVRKFPTYRLQYTGAAQTVAAPAGAQFLVVDLAGAQGGGPASRPGAKGGRLQAVIPIAGGTSIQVNIGQQGGHPAGGWNGGGSGSTGFDVGAQPVSGYGGGGGTDVRIGGTALADRKFVAGAGGGAVGAGTGTGAAGGTGGGATAGNADSTGIGTPAKGGSQSAGGLGGTYGSEPAVQSNNGQPGALGVGGDSGEDIDNVNSFDASGGGGGYYGGGGGVYNVHASGGGGGGSSYADPSAASVIHTQGYQVGNGYATLSFR